MLNRLISEDERPARPAEIYFRRGNDLTVNMVLSSIAVVIGDRDTFISYLNKPLPAYVQLKERRYHV
jgi:hypothetical protein